MKASMRMVIAVVVCPLTALLLADLHARGVDHPSGPVKGLPDWPKGALELANDRARVSGYLVNASDVFFYAGNAETFNAFLARYAALSSERTPHILFIQPGPGRTGPLGAKEKTIAYDWSMEITHAGWDGEQHYNPDPRIERFPVRVRITLVTGGGVDLQKIIVPAHIELRTKAPLEIEQWVMEEKSKRESLKK